MNEDPLLVLVDTNVWISAFIRADGAPAKVLQAFLERRFVPVISQTLLRRGGRHSVGELGAPIGVCLWAATRTRRRLDPE